MQKLEQNQIANLSFKEGKMLESKAAHIYKEVDLLGVGQGLLITMDEWPLKNISAPANLPSRLRTMGRSYKIRVLKDNSGFVITRTS